MDLDDRPLPGPVQVAECGGPCEQQRSRLRRERDTAVQAGLLLADRLQRAEAGLAASNAAIAALRAERSGQQAAVVRVLVALGICGAISILCH